LELEKATAEKRDQLAHMDGALALFGVVDPDAIKPTKPYKRILLFRPGELTSAFLSVMRKGKRPMTTPEIIAATIAALGHERGSQKVMDERIRSCLKYLRERRKSVVRIGKGLGVAWGLKPTE
jgi:hypothetical protein